MNKEYKWREYLSNHYDLFGFSEIELNNFCYRLKDIEWEIYEDNRIEDGSRGAWGDYVLRREIDMLDKTSSEVWNSFVGAFEPIEASWHQYLMNRWFEEDDYSYNQCKNCESFYFTFKTDKRGWCECWCKPVYLKEVCNAFVEGSNVFD